MEEHGKVVAIMPVQRGTSQRTGSQWASLEFVLEMDGRYPRRVVFHLFGEENINKADIRLGEYVTIKAEAEAHEVNGRWFNDIRVWDVVRNGQSILRVSQMQAMVQQASQQQQQSAPANQGQQYAPTGAPNGIQVPPAQPTAGQQAPWSNGGTQAPY